MRSMLLAFLFCLSSVANAQFLYEYPIICDSTENILKSITGEFKETLTWGGRHINDNSAYSLWLNEKTGSWTLLKMTPEVSCILGVGTESKLLLGNPV